MRLITATGRRWRQAIKAFLSIAVLSTFAAVGLSVFGSEVLAVWKTSGDAQQALTGGVFEGLLNFEAPAATVARLKAQQADSEKGTGKVSADSMLARGWKFTQNPTLDAFLLSWSLTFQAVELEGLVRYIQLANPFLPPALVNFLNSFEQAWIQTAIGFQNTLNQFIPPGLRPPPIPPVSPST